MDALALASLRRQCGCKACRGNGYRRSALINFGLLSKRGLREVWPACYGSYPGAQGPYPASRRHERRHFWFALVSAASPCTSGVGSCVGPERREEDWEYQVQQLEVASAGGLASAIALYAHVAEMAIVVPGIRMDVPVHVRRRESLKNLKVSAGRARASLLALDTNCSWTSPARASHRSVGR